MEDWELVADELAAAAGEDGRSAGETCALLLAAVGRGASDSEAVRHHAENDRGVAAAGRLANQDRKQTSARKPSSGQVSAARQSGAGKTSTAAPQNGQNEPHYHRKGASAICVDLSVWRSLLGDHGRQVDAGKIDQNFPTHLALRPFPGHGAAVLLKPTPGVPSISSAQACSSPGLPTTGCFLVW